jgi:hypothetical protein
MAPAIAGILSESGSVRLLRSDIATRADSAQLSLSPLANRRPSARPGQKDLRDINGMLMTLWRSPVKAQSMDTIHVILLITTLVLGFVANVLWGPDFGWLGRDVEAAYIFKLVCVGLIVFFFIAITFGLI